MIYWNVNVLANVAFYKLTPVNSFRFLKFEHLPFHESRGKHRYDNKELMENNSSIVTVAWRSLVSKLLTQNHEKISFLQHKIPITKHVRKISA